jgi:hypothetical protein
MVISRAVCHRLVCAAVTVALALVVLIDAAPLKAQTDPLENAVKATYLYKFAPFVEWPSAVFASPDSPVVLCIVGRDPFGDSLDRAVKDYRIGERSVEVRRPQAADRNSGCHIMFVSGPNAAEILETVRGTQVLTFTDAISDPATKGIVHFVVRDRRVRFEIDDQAAAQNGLTISSKVLSLAVSVRPRA